MFNREEPVLMAPAAASATRNAVRVLVGRMQIFGRDAASLLTPGELDVFSNQVLAPLVSAQDAVGVDNAPLTRERYSATWEYIRQANAGWERLRHMTAQPSRIMRAPIDGAVNAASEGFTSIMEQAPNLLAAGSVGMLVAGGVGVYAFIKIMGAFAKGK